MSSWTRAQFRFSEIILVYPSNHPYNPAVPCPEEGRYHGRRETLARDAVDAAVPSCALAHGRAAQSRTAKSCGPDARMLASSPWEANGSRGRWCQEAPIHQGERDIGRKTIAQGRPDCFR
jgi:hypothetical protein